MAMADETPAPAPAPAVDFRLGRDGLAHACVPGWATAFCGHQCRGRITRGTPCPRCMAAALDRALAAFQD